MRRAVRGTGGCGLPRCAASWGLGIAVGFMLLERGRGVRPGASAPVNLGHGLWLVVHAGVTGTGEQLDE